jgi:hypothetical protein
MSEHCEGCVAQGREDAARDLRLWIHDTHPIIKGFADVDVDAALDVVAGVRGKVQADE